jgi:hypothetical protein
MAKLEKPLKVEIPKAGADQPIWSRVGIIGFAGFLIGIAWPKVAGVKVGPAVPGDLKAQIEATGTPSGSALAPPALSGLPSAAPLAVPSPSASASAEAAVPANQEMVAVGNGKILKCFDKKDKKIDDCEKLLFDPIAVKKLHELAKCPSALGLSGKMTIGFEINFDKREVQVTKAKKGSTGMPSTTVNGILQCAAKEFAGAPLDEVPHKFKRYTLSYGLTFYPPGKHPEGAGEAGGGGDEEGAAGATASETEANGSAVVTMDSAVLRKEPKGKEKAGRLVRGTKVKILGKQNDWYKVESDGKVGWLYRSAIGL